MKHTAIAAAHAAGDILRRYYTQTLNVKTKSNPFDFVTQADIEADHAATVLIAEKFPDHAFWTEETGHNGSDSPYTWLLDPLDGTTNFVHRLPHFAVALAVLHHRQPILAVTFDPIRDELFLAEKGRGCTLNGVPVTVSVAKTPAEALVATGFAPLRNYGAEGEKNLWRIHTMLNETHGVRDSGSAALNMAYVAAGRLDIYWTLRLNPWDWVGGALMVEEAGGTVTDFDGSPWTVDTVGVLATNGKLHAAARQLLG